LNIGGLSSKSKYFQYSIVNKYREGKVKRPETYELKELEI